VSESALRALGGNLDCSGAIGFGDPCYASGCLPFQIGHSHLSRHCAISRAPPLFLLTPAATLAPAFFFFVCLPSAKHLRPHQQQRQSAKAANRRPTFFFGIWRCRHERVNQRQRGQPKRRSQQRRCLLAGKGNKTTTKTTPKQKNNRQATKAVSNITK